MQERNQVCGAIRINTMLLHSKNDVIAVQSQWYSISKHWIWNESIVKDITLWILMSSVKNGVIPLFHRFYIRK